MWPPPLKEEPPSPNDPPDSGGQVSSSQDFEPGGGNGEGGGGRRGGQDGSLDNKPEVCTVMRTILLRMAQALQCTGFAADRVYDLEPLYKLSIPRPSPIGERDSPMNHFKSSTRRDQAYRSLVSEFRLFKQIALASLEDIQATIQLPSSPARPPGEESSSSGQEQMDVASLLRGSRSAIITFVTEMEHLIRGASGEDRLTEEVKACDSPLPIPRLPNGWIAPKTALIALRSAEHVMQLAATARLHGFLPHLVRNGGQALSRYSDSAYHLVIIDAYFPMLSGLETVRCIRKYENRLEFHSRSQAARGSFVVVVRNGYPIDKFEERALKAGADHCVEKIDEISFSSIDAIIDGDEGMEANESDEVCSIACSTLSTLSSAGASQKAHPNEEEEEEEEKDDAMKCDGERKSPGSAKRNRADMDAKLPPIETSSSPEEDKPQPESDITRMEEDRESPQEDSTELRGDEDDDLEMRTWAETPKKGASAAAPAAASAATLDNGQDAPRIRRACAYCHTKKVSCTCTRPCARCVDLNINCTDYEPKHRINKKRRVDRSHPAEEDGRPGPSGYIANPLGALDRDGIVPSVAHSSLTSFGTSAGPAHGVPYSSLILPTTTTAQSKLHMYTTPIVTTGNLALEQPSTAALRLPSYHYPPTLPSLPSPGPMTPSAFLDPRVTATGRLLPIGMANQAANFSTSWPWSGGTPSTTPMVTTQADSSPYGDGGVNANCSKMGGEAPMHVGDGKILKRYVMDHQDAYSSYFKGRSPSRSGRGSEGSDGVPMLMNGEASQGSGGGYNANSFNGDIFFAEDGE